MLHIKVLLTQAPSVRLFCPAPVIVHMSLALLDRKGNTTGTAALCLPVQTLDLDTTLSLLPQVPQFSCKRGLCATFECPERRPNATAWDAPGLEPTARVAQLDSAFLSGCVPLCRRLRRALGRDETVPHEQLSSALIERLNH